MQLLEKAVLITGITGQDGAYRRVAWTNFWQAAGVAVDFKGEAENEVGIDAATGKTVMRVNPKFYRPAEVELLIGNPEKAKQKLGWEPQTTLEQLCAMMVEADLKRVERGVSF